MKGTSLRQDQNFKEAIFNDNDFLSKAIEWISENMNPDDVFDHKDLEDWAEEHDFVHTSKIHEK